MGGVKTVPGFETMDCSGQNPVYIYIYIYTYVGGITSLIWLTGVKIVFNANWDFLVNTVYL